MQTHETSQRAGPDAKLRLEIPVEKPGQAYHVIVVIDEQSQGDTTMVQWPPDYFEATAGAWQGDFPRDVEGDFERREPL